MEKLVPCYEVKVRGQYQAADGKNRILKTFGPVTFVLPEYVQIPNGKKKVEKIVNGQKTQSWEQQFKKAAVSGDNIALYIVQRRLLPAWLADNHADCVVFRTCSIVPGGLRKVMRPAKDAQTLEKPVEEMNIPELVAFCKLKNINLALGAFTDAREAREAVLYEMEILAENRKTQAHATENSEYSSSAQSASPETGEDEEDKKKYGITTKRGKMTRDETLPADDVPVDNEDPAENLI